MKHKEPEIVTTYRNMKNAHPPTCCHTCDFYDNDGICIKFGEQPPEDFAATAGACASWQWEIPF
jgi:hypothetical protein